MIPRWLKRLFGAIGEGASVALPETSKPTAPTETTVVVKSEKAPSRIEHERDVAQRTFRQRADVKAWIAETRRMVRKEIAGRTEDAKPPTTRDETYTEPTPLEWPKP